MALTDQLIALRTSREIFKIPKAELIFVDGDPSTGQWSLASGEQLAVGTEVEIVITSYSIHYTKLYEGGIGLVAAPECLTEQTMCAHRQFQQHLGIIETGGSHTGHDRCAVDHSQPFLGLQMQLRQPEARQHRQGVDFLRITSYNVCYTKLLRGLRAFVAERVAQVQGLDLRHGPDVPGHENGHHGRTPILV